MQVLMQTTIIDALKRRGQSGRLGKQYGDKRDLYNVLGYLPIPQVEDYWQMFLRQDIAKRVIKAPAIASWRNPPIVQETANPLRETKFEKAFDLLVKRVKLWSYLKRLDVLSGVGYYGVMLLGVSKGQLKNPITPGSFKNVNDLLFLSVFSQRHAQVKEFGADPQVEDYGKPLTYNIDLSGDIANSQGRAAAQARRSSTTKASSAITEVDASRVLHFAEELTEDEVNGTPRLEPVVNRMFDIEKVAGGSAEMYWRGAYGGFALEAAENSTSAFASAGEIDPALIDEWAHGMRRWIDLEGYKLKEVTGQDVNPQEVFTMLIQLVSSATSIPSRILVGSERGELASSQDERNWNDFIVDRRNELCGPKVREFIDRMISWGILPAPKDYEVVWPDVGTPTEQERATIFKTWAEGIAALAPAGAPDLIINPREVRVKFLKLPADMDLGDGTPAADDIPQPDDQPQPEPTPAPAPAVPVVNNRRNIRRVR